MFNIGAGEIAFILVAALLVLGPKRLPELARGMGRFFRDFRRQTDDLRNVVEREFYRMDQTMESDVIPDLGKPMPPLELPRVPRSSENAAQAALPIPTSDPELLPPSSGTPIASRPRAPALAEAAPASVVTAPPPSQAPAKNPAGAAAPVSTEGSRSGGESA